VKPVQIVKLVRSIGLENTGSHASNFMVEIFDASQQAYEKNGFPVISFITTSVLGALQILN